MGSIIHTESRIATVLVLIKSKGIGSLFGRLPMPGLRIRFNRRVRRCQFLDHVIFHAQFRLFSIHHSAQGTNLLQIYKMDTNETFGYTISSFGGVLNHNIKIV
jgi:hypothetical protein